MPKKSAKKGPSGKTEPVTPPSRPAPSDTDLPPPAGYLISCDVPTKQYIQYKNLLIEPNDKKFVLKGGDLDANHLLIKQIVNKKDAKEYILDEVEKWENENVFSATEKVGEDFDLA